MKVSVIIPVYNVEKYLRRCLESVAAQTILTSEPEVDVECILVDDCGSDASMQIAREYVEAYSGPVQWRIAAHSHNRGLSAARNTGLDMATGDYVLFVDSDDELLPQAVEMLLNTSRTYPDADMVQGDVQFEGESYAGAALNYEALPEFTSDKEWIMEELYLSAPVNAWNKLFNRKWIEHNGLRFCEGLIHEDDHWLLQSRSVLNGVAWCKSPTYLHRIVANSIMTQPYRDRHYASKIKIYREFLPTVQSQNLRHYFVLATAHRMADKVHLMHPERLAAQIKEMAKKFQIDKSVPPYIPTAIRYIIKPSLYTKVRARFTDTRLYCLLVLVDREMGRKEGILF